MICTIMKHAKMNQASKIMKAIMAENIGPVVKLMQLESVSGI